LELCGKHIKHFIVDERGEKNSQNIMSGRNMYENIDMLIKAEQLIHIPQEIITEAEELRRLSSGFLDIYGSCKKRFIVDRRAEKGFQSGMSGDDVDEIIFRHAKEIKAPLITFDKPCARRAEEINVTTISNVSLFVSDWMDICASAKNKQKMRYVNHTNNYTAGRQSRPLKVKTN